MLNSCKADKMSICKREGERKREKKSSLRTEFKGGGEPERIKLKISVSTVVCVGERHSQRVTEVSFTPAACFSWSEPNTKTF